MADLVFGIIVMGMLSALLLVGVLRLARSAPRRTVNLLAIMIVAMMLAQSLLIHDSIILTRLLPVSNLVVVGNWAPLLVAALAGLIWQRVPPPAWRRGLIIGSLVIACLVAIYAPILSPAPKMNDRWLDGVCVQTSQASCSPAAAATLLHAYKIKTTEQEMAVLCLTSTRGTSMHGLWRGMRLKTEGTGYDVYMFQNGTIDDLRGMGPVLLSVELKPGANVDPVYQSALGWMPGVPHSIVLMGFVGHDRVLIADPSTGLETWSLKDLDVLWHGTGVRLIQSKL